MTCTCGAISSFSRNHMEGCAATIHAVNLDVDARDAKIREQQATIESLQDRAKEDAVHVRRLESIVQTANGIISLLTKERDEWRTSSQILECTRLAQIDDRRSRDTTIAELRGTIEILHAANAQLQKENAHLRLQLQEAK